MDNAIFKYELKERYTVLEMNEGATILCVKEQRGVVVLYAQLEMPAPIAVQRRRFAVLATGYHPSYTDVLNKGTYIGTVMLDAGATVLHVYETKQQKGDME